jgi:hypothetical protein
VVTLEHENDFMAALRTEIAAAEAPGAIKELVNVTVNGSKISRAYILTFNRRAYSKRTS